MQVNCDDNDLDEMEIVQRADMGEKPVAPQQSQRAHSRKGLCERPSAAEGLIRGRLNNVVNDSNSLHYKSRKRIHRSTKKH